MREHDIYKSFINVRVLETQLRTIGNNTFDIVPKSLTSTIYATCALLEAIESALHDIYDEAQNEQMEKDKSLTKEHINVIAKII